MAFDLDRLPQSWKWVRLSEITEELESGSRPKGGVRGIASGVPSIGGEHLADDGAFDFHSIRYVPKSFATSMKRGRVRPQDILIVKDGATTGKTSFVTENFPYGEAVLNEHVFRLRVFPQTATQSYIFHFLRSPLGQKMIQDSFRGSAQGGINQKFAKLVHVPIAPIPEQKRIVNKLELAFRQVSSSKQALSKIYPILKRVRQSVLTKAFRGELTERDLGDPSEQPLIERINEMRRGRERFRTRAKDKITSKSETIHPLQSEDLPQLPRGWVWVRLGQLIAEPLRNGKSALPAQVSRGVPVLRLSAVTFKDFGPSNVKSCALEGADVKDLWVKADDILIARSNTREYVGMAAIYEGPNDLFVYPDLMIRARADKEIILPKFLAQFLDCQFARDYFRDRAGGTAGSMPKISQTDIESLPVPLAPIREQEQVVKKIHDIFTRADIVELAVKEGLRESAIIERVVLTRAFRGKLVSQNPQDEPVSMLLERTRTQRSVTESKSGRQGLEEFASAP